MCSQTSLQSLLLLWDVCGCGLCGCIFAVGHWTELPATDLIHVCWWMRVIQPHLTNLWLFLRDIFSQPGSLSGRSLCTSLPPRSRLLSGCVLHGAPPSPKTSSSSCSPAIDESLRPTSQFATVGFVSSHRVMLWRKASSVGMWNLRHLRQDELQFVAKGRKLSPCFLYPRLTSGGMDMKTIRAWSAGKWFSHPVAKH